MAFLLHKQNLFEDLSGYSINHKVRLPHHLQSIQEDSSDLYMFCFHRAESYTIDHKVKLHLQNYFCVHKEQEGNQNHSAELHQDCFLTLKVLSKECREARPLADLCTVMGTEGMLVIVAPVVVLAHSDPL